MNSITEKLWEEMSADMQRVKRDSQSILEQAERCYQIVLSRLEELRGFILEYNYKDKEEEIRFFKIVKPKFLSELMYHAELFEIEAHVPIGSAGKQKKHYIRVLDRIALFFGKRNEFYIYYRTGKTSLDEQLFLSNHNDRLIFPEVYMVNADPRFFRPASYRVARIMAYEKLHEYVTAVLTRLKSPRVSGGDHLLNWTGSKSDLIELAYAIQSRGAVNNGNVEVKQIITSLELLFNVQVGNFYRTFQNMRGRKKDRTPFLSALIKSVEDRMDETDMNF
jgi:hypothetical protein